MKQKLFTLLTLLVGIASGAWGSTGTEKIRYNTVTSETAYSGTSVYINGSTAPKYVAGNGSKQSSGMEGKGMKMRTNQTNVTIDDVKYNTIVIDVNDTYTITSFKMVAGSNNASTNVTVKGVYADANYSTNLINADVPMTNATAGTVNVPSLSASTSITIAFSTDSYNQINAEFDFGWSKLDIENLTTPVISFDGATGDVTIGNVANATKITYTTDGSAPNASSTTYDGTFNVADGTTVKAIAIGDGVSYANSDVAEKYVTLTGITISDPVINAVNGTVAITCASPGSTIEYSLDNGESWNTYTKVFTLTADGTVKAKASRESCTPSGEVSKDVAIVTSTKTRTLYMGYGSFKASGDNKTLTGNADDDAEGFTLTFSTTDKTWNKGVKFTTAPFDKTAIIGSNGASSILTIPEGMIATKLTLYSYIVADGGVASPCGWKDVAGENYQSGSVDYKLIPMGTYRSSDDVATNPDVRVYPLDNVTGSLSFTSAGNQLAFVIALDVIETVSVSTLADRNYASYVPTKKLDFASADGITAYIATGLNAGGTAVVLQKVDVVDAGTPVIVKTDTKGATVNVPVTTADPTDASGNKLVAGDGTTSYSAGTYYYLANDQFHQATSGTLQSGKAYLQISGSLAPQLAISFGNEGGTTGINAVNGSRFTVNGEYYNLAGQRVAQPTKGLYIVNGKKVVVK